MLFLGDRLSLCRGSPPSASEVDYLYKKEVTVSFLLLPLEPNDYLGRDIPRIMSSGVTIDEVYSEIKKIRAEMVRREDVEALVDTLEILSNPATMQLIHRSEADIIHGRVKGISSVDDLLRVVS